MASRDEAIELVKAAVDGKRLIRTPLGAFRQMVDGRCPLAVHLGKRDEELADSDNDVIFLAVSIMDGVSMELARQLLEPLVRGTDVDRKTVEMEQFRDKVKLYAGS